MSLNFNTTMYFSTKLQTFGKGQQQTGGIWSFTHSSVIDPNYMGKGWFKRETGLKWWQIKKVMADLFMDRIDDPSIIEKVKTHTAPLIPVRSGRLMERLFSSMKILRDQKKLTEFWAVFTYKWSIKRPYPIMGRVAHSTPEKGYGEWGSVKLTEPHAISRVKIDHVTAGGNALYILDDPAAMQDPTPVINSYAEDLIYRDFAEKFNFVLEVSL